MSTLPRTFEESLDQLAQAVTLGLAQKKLRGQIEVRTPGLEVGSLLPTLMAVLPHPLLVLFPDAGAAALATRSLGITEGVTFRGLGTLPDLTSIASFLLVETSGVEIGKAEQIANQAQDRPFILLNPQLEAGAVGIGLAGRQLRTRFLSTLTPYFYLAPLEGGAVLRAFPGNWQIWREGAEDYTLVTELGQRPTPEDLNLALQQKGAGFFDQLEQMIRALGR